MKNISFMLCLFGMGIAVGFMLRGGKSHAQAIPAIQSTVGQNTSSESAPMLSHVSQGSFPVTQQTHPTSSAQLPPASGIDPSTLQHSNPNGGRTDIVQVGPMTASQETAYTGDDITFNVTLENMAPYKKFVRSVCFNSNGGNFGCSPGFNLNPGQVFSISNSGRFTSSGLKTIRVSWSQDGENYLNPVHAASAVIRIL